MASNYENYQSWFVFQLRKLFSEQDAGFVILMVAFPLLERYIRQKIKLPPDQSLNDFFYKELVVLFPVLQDDQVAKWFWNIYRNGILHQVTLSQEDRKGTPLPIGWISQKYHVPMKIESNGSLWIHPVLFAQQVLHAVESDFSTFEGHTSSAPRLPVVEPLTTTQPTKVSSMYLGTRGGP